MQTGASRPTCKQGAGAPHPNMERRGVMFGCLQDWMFGVASLRGVFLAVALGLGQEEGEVAVDRRVEGEADVGAGHFDV